MHAHVLNTPRMTTSDKPAHWSNVYSTKAESSVSWYKPHLQRSLDLISGAGLLPDASIIDVGAGASTLVDDLFEQGFTKLTALDLADSAFKITKARLGAKASSVQWLVGDVTTFPLSHHAYDLWHDRAVFHFLTEPQQREQYVKQVCHAVKPGGFVIVATFGPHGPERCSGLPVVRYSAEQLHAEFGSPFTLVSSAIEEHETPWGTSQEFVYCCCRRA